MGCFGMRHFEVSVLEICAGFGSFGNYLDQCLGCIRLSIGGKSSTDRRLFGKGILCFLAGIFGGFGLLLQDKDQADFRTYRFYFQKTWQTNQKQNLGLIISKTFGRSPGKSQKVKLLLTE